MPASVSDFAARSASTMTQRVPSTARRRASRGSCRARWPFRSTPTMWWRLVRWAAADERPARAAWIGEQHGRRRHRRRRRRRPEPARRRGIGGRLHARTIRVAGRAPCATRWTARRAQWGSASPSIRRAARSARWAGWPSTNAAGAHTLRYGAMRSWVEALDCVFADGSRAELRRGAPAPRTPLVARALDALAPVIAEERASPSRHVGVRKDSSGYGLGGIRRIGQIWSISRRQRRDARALRRARAPTRPAAAARRRACSAPSRRSRARSCGADGARRTGAVACELLDRTFLDVARRGGARVPAPEDAESVLLAEVEADTPEEATAMVRAIESEFEPRARRRHAGARPRHGAALWELRHAASPILTRLDPSLTSMQFIEDACVPPERLADYVRGVRAALEHHGIARRDLRPRRRRARARESARRRGAARLAVARRRPPRRRDGAGRALGGTLTGEHGDGRLRTPLLPRVWSAESVARFAAVKRAFDPAGILNPGAKVAVEGERAVADVKYDPSLPPLPEPARVALARVERERAYARSRLDAAG